MTTRLVLLLALGAVLPGCGPPKPATVTGQLVLGGEPFALPADAGQVFVSLHGFGEDGAIDPFKKYDGMVRADGRFEIVSSGGELPPGPYQWSIDGGGNRVKEFAPFRLANTKGRVELKPGPNQLALDLSVSP